MGHLTEAPLGTLQRAKSLKKWGGWDELEAERRRRRLERFRSRTKATTSAATGGVSAVPPSAVEFAAALGLSILGEDGGFEGGDLALDALKEVDADLPSLEGALRPSQLPLLLRTTDEDRPPERPAAPPKEVPVEIRPPCASAHVFGPATLDPASGAQVQLCQHCGFRVESMDL
jgi:hypothetical protein